MNIFIFFNFKIIRNSKCNVSTYLLILLNTYYIIIFHCLVFLKYYIEIFKYIGNSVIHYTNIKKP